MIKVIWEHILLICSCTIVALMLLLLSESNAQSITLKDHNKFTTEVLTTCSDYGLKCTIHIIDSNKIRAYTYPDGNIYFTTALLERTSYKEALAIAYHEIGHNALSHTKRYIKQYSDNYPLSKEKSKIILHQHEIEADMFSQYTASRKGEKNYLPDALLKISNPQYRNRTTDTHPSINNRIEIMKQNSTSLQELIK